MFLVYFIMLFCYSLIISLFYYFTNLFCYYLLIDVFNKLTIRVSAYLYICGYFIIYVFNSFLAIWLCESSIICVWDHLLNQWFDYLLIWLFDYLIILVILIFCYLSIWLFYYLIIRLFEYMRIVLIVSLVTQLCYEFIACVFDYLGRFVMLFVVIYIVN